MNGPVLDGSLVASASLGGFRAAVGLGINAEVDLMGQCLGVPYAELMGVTGTAFRTHFFAPEMNPGLDDAPAWSWSSLRHNNYGQYESAAYYYGGQVFSVEHRNAVQNWKLLRFELDAGRPVILYGVAREPVPVLVVGYSLHRGPLRQSLLLAGADPIDVTGGVLDTVELVLVRPGETPPHRGSDESRRVDVMGWAVGHVRANREMIYETSRFYAAGASALRQSARFLREASTAEELAFLTCFVEELLRARTCAVEFVAAHVSTAAGDAIAVETAALSAAQARLATGDVLLGADHLDAAAAAQLQWAEVLQSAGLSGAAR
jgi:hypothetical protein